MAITITATAGSASANSYLTLDAANAIIEGLIGRRIPTKTLILIQWIGVTLLMILFFIIIKNDISTILSL